MSGVSHVAWAMCGLLLATLSAESLSVGTNPFLLRSFADLLRLDDPETPGPAMLGLVLMTVALGAGLGALMMFRAAFG